MLKDHRLSCTYLPIEDFTKKYNNIQTMPIQHPQWSKELISHALFLRLSRHTHEMQMQRGNENSSLAFEMYPSTQSHDEKCSKQNTNIFYTFKDILFVDFMFLKTWWTCKSDCAFVM